jgi:chromosome segregation ATPase
MPLPTVDQFLAKLAANPADAAEFDEHTRRERPHCKTRREAVEATLAAVQATLAENQAAKATLDAKKAKQAALETARVTHARLTAELATTRTKLSTLESARKSQPVMKTIPSPTKAPIVKLTSAADYQNSISPPTMTRSEFHKLTPAQRNLWIREGGRLA